LTALRPSTRIILPRIGHFKDGLSMTSYEAGIFLPDEQAAVFPQPSFAIRDMASVRGKGSWWPAEPKPLH
jgi:hypothetical protein